MRRLWLLVIFAISLLTIVNGSLLHRAISVLLSGLLSFSSLTGNGHLFDSGRANAVVPINSTITDTNTDIHLNKDICIPFMGCIKTPLPGGLENVVNDVAKREAYNSLRKIIASEVPIVGTTEHKLYKRVNNLPGKVFAPKTLDIASLQDSDTLPFGDYEIPAHFYCTKVYTLNGSGNRYVLGKLNGKMSDALSTLYARASKTGKSTGDVQVLSWSIQAGVPYDDLSGSSKALVDELIPEYKGKMDVGFYEKLIDTWNEVSSLTKLPSLNETLDRLGSTGDFTKSLLRAREEILQSAFSSRPLADSFVIPRDANLPGGSVETPWSQVHEQVYIRFIASRGALSDGVVQVRVLELPSQNKHTDKEQKVAQIPLPLPIILVPPPILIGGIVLGVLVWLIVTSVGIPEATGHQAITATLIKEKTDVKPPTTDPTPVPSPPIFPIPPIPSVDTDSKERETLRNPPNAIELADLRGWKITDTPSITPAIPKGGIALKRVPTFTVTIVKRPMKLKFYDAGTSPDDGDIVDVYLNGTRVRRNLVLNINYAEVVFPENLFQPGINKIAIKSVSVGNVEPNTVGIIFPEEQVVDGKARDIRFALEKGQTVEATVGFPQIALCRTWFRFPCYEIQNQGVFPESANHVLQAQREKPSPISAPTKPVMERDTAGRRRPIMTPRTRTRNPLRSTGYPRLLTVDRNEEKRRYADLRRVLTLDGYKLCPLNIRKQAQDRDEYPPAVFLESMGLAHIKCIERRDNQNSGSSFGNQLNGYRERENGHSYRIDNGDTIEFVILD